MEERPHAALIEPDEGRMVGPISFEGGHDHGRRPPSFTRNRKHFEPWPRCMRRAQEIHRTSLATVARLICLALVGAGGLGCGGSSAAPAIGFGAADLATVAPARRS